MLSANISIGGLYFHVKDGAEPRRLIKQFKDVLDIVKKDVPERKLGLYFQAMLLRQFIDGSEWIKVGFLQGAAIDYRLHLDDDKLNYAVVENMTTGEYIFV